MQPRQGTYTRELRDRAIYLYTVEMMGCYSISKKVGFSEPTVKKHLRKDGVQIRGLHESLALRPTKTPEEKQKNHIQSVSKRNRIYRENANRKRQEFIAEFLVGKSCVDCGYSNILALEFDHRKPTEKSFTISKFLSKNHASEAKMKLLREELQKCDVVCSNCHAIRTAKTFGSWRLRYVNMDHSEVGTSTPD